MQSVLYHKAESKIEGNFTPFNSCLIMPQNHEKRRQSEHEQLQTTLKIFQQALTRAEANNNYIAQVESLKLIGLIHCKLGQYTWGIKCLEQSLRYAQGIKEQATIGIILNYLGAAYYQTGQDRKALWTYSQALTIFSAENDVINVARLLNRIGQICNSLKQAERALMCCRQSLKMYQGLKNHLDGESTALQSIGEAHLQLGRPRAAIAFFEQALVINRKIGNRKNEATTLEDIGTAYIKLSPPLRALQSYQQALEIRRQIDDKIGEARNLNYIGAVYYQLGRHSRALCYHLQALRVLKTLNQTADSEKLLHHLVAVYEYFGWHDLGVKCYEQALEIVKTFGTNPCEEAIALYCGDEDEFDLD
ncbi:MAG: tetratricopeptide repeat protein [Coleofasciculaceae cyanobacterium]